MSIIRLLFNICMNYRWRIPLNHLKIPLITQKSNNTANNIDSNLILKTPPNIGYIELNLD